MDPIFLLLLFYAGLVAAAVLGGRCAAGFARWRLDPRRPKPPLGWSPWERPTAARRVSYAARYGWWKVRATACRVAVRLGVKACH